MDQEKPDLVRIREKLEKLKGPRFWKSLDELAETEEFEKFLKEEYPYGATPESTEVNRREFLKLMGASLLMGGLAGCSPPPPGKIVPYVKAPEQIIPGKPLYFATSMPFNGAAIGLLAKSHMGRPTHIEGHPDHPDSLGATHVWAQASILDLYDPDRAKAIIHSGHIRTWDAFSRDLLGELEKQTAQQGAGVRILTEPVTSPTLAAQIHRFLEKYPQAKWHQYTPVSRESALQGTKKALGRPVDTLYNIKNADVIVSLDSDFLYALPGSLRYSKEFASRRQVPEPSSDMNRLYTVESAPSLTGAMADNRLTLPPSEVLAFAFALASALGVRASGVPSASLPARHNKWVEEIARDLQAHKGKSLIVAGAEQPPSVHALAAAMNQALNNHGRTVFYIDPIDENPTFPRESLKELSDDLNGGKVDLLMVLGGNPVYNAPADFEFEKSYRKARRRVYLGRYADETAALSHWHIPESHYLEIFSDARASDGTVSMIQPLIHPLYEGTKSAHELMEAALGSAVRQNDVIVKAYWQTQWGEQGFEAKWRKALHDGLLPETAFKPLEVTAKTSFSRQDLEPWLPSRPLEDSIEIAFRPDPSIWDGRFANNGWLQELPKMLTTLTWDNAALISPRFAEEKGLSTGDIVEVSKAGTSLKTPVLIFPGHPDRSLTLHLGYGRRSAGRLGSQIGVNTYRLRHSSHPGFSTGFKISKTGQKQALAVTQNHHSMEGRHLVRKATQEEYREQPDFATKPDHPIEGTSMYPPHSYDSYAWGMAVNLNACTGCNACVIACQSENNIPVVGKDEVARGREMHWIRLDRYYEGNMDQPEMLHQPVLCMHCEKAPCEPVCPVGATVHSSEGLNEMIYNRCVGTRYCSNNCPYKVRRFNFFEYTDPHTETLKMQRNPNVTVRGRGVMEKCTFCVQRINEARIEAKKENRKIKEGEVITACQSACPTNALVFGDINDPDSEVSRLKATPLDYGLLTELNTLPRVTYLAKVNNPNPKLLTHAESHG